MKMKKYQYSKANQLISKFMNEDKDYKSIDNLIPVWKQISGKLWDMQGFMFDFSLDHDGTWDFTLSSNWSGRGLGGYSDAIEYDLCYEEGCEDLTAQERALIITARLIAYEIYKDYSSDFYEEKNYSETTSNIFNEERYVNYTYLQKLSEKDPDLLISLIKENEVPSHIMYNALSNLGKVKNEESYNLLIYFLKDKHIRIRRGAIEGLYYFYDKKDILNIYNKLLDTEKNYYNLNEIKRLIKIIEGKINDSKK